MNGVPLNINFQQIMLHLFNFAILFCALYFILYKPVKKFMDNRVKTYKDMDENAKLNLKEAEDKNNELSEKIKAFDLETKELKAKARAEMNEQKKKVLDDAKKEAEEIIKTANKQAEKEKEDLLKSAEKDIAEMVTRGTEKVLKSNPSFDAFDEFLKETENM